MKSVEFCYWLQGMFELSNPAQLNANQTELIRKHLAMVFKHEIDPSYPADQQDDLNVIHNGTHVAPSYLSPNTNFCPSHTLLKC